MSKHIYPRFIIVKDDFYENPLNVYKEARDAKYYEPEFYTGLRSLEVYHPPGVKQKLEKILGIKITRWDTDPEDENGVFYSSYSKGKHKEIPGVHADLPHDDMTVLIYLTPGL